MTTKMNMIKAIGATVVSTGLILGTVAPMSASARETYVCQVEKKDDAKTGMILGAIAGGLLGSQAIKHEKGLGAVGGAVIGGVLGNKLGKDHGKSTCNKIEAQARETYGYRSTRRTTYRQYSQYGQYDRGYAYGYR